MEIIPLSTDVDKSLVLPTLVFISGFTQVLSEIPNLLAFFHFLPISGCIFQIVVHKHFTDFTDVLMKKCTFSKFS